MTNEFLVQPLLFITAVAFVQTFFNNKTESAVREAIPNFYGVNYVYSPREFDAMLGSTNGLELVLSNGNFSVWKVAL